MVDAAMLAELAERWLPIPDFEGLYEASDFGRVRSLDRWVLAADSRLIPMRGRIMTPSLAAPHFYYSVKLSKNGRAKRYNVHRLVLLTFRGLPLEGQVGCHNDGNSFNNVLSNLRWDTSSANVQDTIRHGHFVVGAKPKERCKRGHEMCAANLYWDPSGKHRICLACIRTRTAVELASARGIDLDFQILSDAFFDWIIESSQETNEPPAPEPIVSSLPGDIHPYAFIAKELENQIRAGLLLAGTHLPPTRELAEAYGCGTTTVKVAYKRLTTAGLIQMRPGQRALILGAQVGRAASTVSP